ncbi:hypothetical protein D3C85_977760 [compost metagenome]
MVPRQDMEPTFEVLYFMNLQLANQLFKNLHDRILALFLIFQIVQADPKYQVHVLIVQLAQYLQVAADFISGNQSSIVLLLDSGIIFNKFQ